MGLTGTRGLGEDLTHVFRHELRHCVPNSVRVGASPCVPQRSSSQFLSLLARVTSSESVPLHFRSAYFQSIFDSPFVGILHAHESYAVTIMEGLHFPLH